MFDQNFMLINFSCNIRNVSEVYSEQHVPKGFKKIAKRSFFCRCLYLCFSKISETKMIACMPNEHIVFAFPTVRTYARCVA